MNKVEQTVSTRNQSTMQYSFSHIFLFDNRFEKDVTFLNNTGGVLELVPGSLVMRNADDATQVIPATAAGIANIIGVVSTDGVIELADAATTTISYAVGCLLYTSPSPRDA